MEQRENGRPASLARSLTLINDRNLLAHPCQSFEERRGELKWVKKHSHYIYFAVRAKQRARERGSFVHPADSITHRLHLITIRLFPLRSSPPPPGPFCLGLSAFNYALTMA